MGDGVGEDGHDGKHDESADAEPSAQNPRYDKLTVFQAAPLAYRSDDGTLRTIAMPDFDRERELLTESLLDAEMVGAEIDLVFETATTDRLGAFLAQSETQVLHISCHGHPAFLCFEDGSGGAQFLSAEDLRGFMAAGSGGGSELRVVIVSACYSEAAGNAFLEAGVPHVVCCQQDVALMDAAAIEFCRSFFRALACGKNLRESFELGTQAVKLSPSVADAENEMKKFLLLPENADHDVPVFYTKARRRIARSRLKSLPPPPWIIPHPPVKFIGRELDLYNVLVALRKEARFIKILGTQGVGKRSFAAALLQYLEFRCRIFSIKQFIWLPLIHSSMEESMSSCFRELFEILQNEHPASMLVLDSKYRSLLGTVIEQLQTERAHIVIDSRDFVADEAFSKLSMFIKEVLRATRNVKIIYLCDHSADISDLCGVCYEYTLPLGPLDFEATSTLFGTICPFVSERRSPRVCSPGQLAKLLVPNGQEKCTIHTKGLSNRGTAILQLIGEGIPAKIHEKALAMSPREYDELIDVASRKEYTKTFASRAELEVELSKMEKELYREIRANNFPRAREIQLELEEVERLRGTLQDIAELKNIAQDLNGNLVQAIIDKDFAKAGKLREQQLLIEERIKNEETASSGVNKEMGVSEVDEYNLPPAFSTRVELEVSMQRMRDEMEDSAGQANYERAGRLQRSIHDLEKHRRYLPSKVELSEKINFIKHAEKKATDGRDFVRAASLHQEREMLEKKLAIEKSKETEIFFERGSPVTPKAEEEHEGNAIAGREHNNHIYNPSKVPNLLKPTSLKLVGRSRSVPTHFMPTPPEVAFSTPLRPALELGGSEDTTNKAHAVTWVPDFQKYTRAIQTEARVEREADSTASARVSRFEERIRPTSRGAGTKSDAESNREVTANNETLRTAGAGTAIDPESRRTEKINNELLRTGAGAGEDVDSRPAANTSTGIPVFSENVRPGAVPVAGIGGQESSSGFISALSEPHAHANENENEPIAARLVNDGTSRSRPGAARGAGYRIDENGRLFLEHDIENGIRYTDGAKQFTKKDMVMMLLIVVGCILVTAVLVFLITKYS